MVIEIYARLSLHHSLAAYCGIDYAYLLYLDSLGEAVGVKCDYSRGVKWVAAPAGARVFRDYHKEYHLSLIDWIRSYRGPKTFADWSWDDPWPFVRQCVVLLPSVL